MSAHSPAREGKRNEHAALGWLACRRLVVPDPAAGLRRAAAGLDAADLDQDTVRRRAVPAGVVAAQSYAAELYPPAVAQQRCRPGVPDLSAEQPLGLVGDHGAGRDRRRTGGLCVLPLPLPRS